MMPKEKFLMDAEAAISKIDTNYELYLEITNRAPAREIIINPTPNLKSKRDYLKRAYDDNLRLKTAHHISIYRYEFQPNGPYKFWPTDSKVFNWNRD